MRTGERIKSISNAIRSILCHGFEEIDNLIIDTLIQLINCCNFFMIHVQWLNCNSMKRRGGVKRADHVFC